ncbi:hypothetical protein MIMGU_mgv1a0131842mg, partial [Erythranthe guttata]|jgi:hypothetical protein
MDLY